DHDWVAQSKNRPFDQPKDGASQSRKRQGRAAPVEARRSLWVAALDDVTHREQDGGERDQWIDEEDPTPRRMVDDEAAQNRTDRGKDGREAGPGPDRFAALGLVERCSDDRQRTRSQEGGSDTLGGPGGDELRGAWSKTAPQRGRREDDRPNHEDPAAPKMI